MSGLVNRITAVQSAHHLERMIHDGGPVQCCCKCQWIGPNHDWHVAERVAAELQLTDLIEVINNMWMVDKDGQKWVHQGYLHDAVSGWSAVEEKHNGDTAG